MNPNIDCYYNLRKSSCTSVCAILACQNIRFSSLFAAVDVSRGGTRRARRNGCFRMLVQYSLSQNSNKITFSLTLIRPWRHNCTYRNQKGYYPGTLKHRIEGQLTYYKTKEYLPFWNMVYSVHILLFCLSLLFRKQKIIYCYLLVEISTSHLSQNINSY